jgi:hypothetical protein
MLLRTPTKVAIVSTCIVLTGCASFEPGMSYQDLMRPRQSTVKDTQEGLEVSIEEFVSKDKSMKAFDADLAPNDILALLLKVENNGTQTYRIDEHALSVYLGNEALPSVSGKRAASQAADSEYVGKALGWTVATGPFAPFVWPLTIGGSASHTAAVNKRIEEHFESISFNYSVLKPNQYTAGFLYFQLPPGVKKLENLRVETALSEEGTGNRLYYTLLLPALDRSGTVATSPANQSSGSQP